MDQELTGFRERLLRFDSGALVRLKNGRAWAWLPWDVLVAIPAPAAGDEVIAAGSGERRDADWRGPLPPTDIRVLDDLPAEILAKAAAAAAQTLREVNEAGLKGRAVGQRAIREALLDHPVITGTSDADGSQYVVRQRLVQAIVRMRLVSPGTVGVLAAGPWTGLRTSSGEAWHRQSAGLTLRPLR